MPLAHTHSFFFPHYQKPARSPCRSLWPLLRCRRSLGTPIVELFPRPHPRGLGSGNFLSPTRLARSLPGPGLSPDPPLPGSQGRAEQEAAALTWDSALWANSGCRPGASRAGRGSALGWGPGSAPGGRGGTRAGAPEARPAPPRVPRSTAGSRAPRLPGPRARVGQPQRRPDVVPSRTPHGAAVGLYSNKAAPPSPSRSPLDPAELTFGRRVRGSFGPRRPGVVAVYRHAPRAHSLWGLAWGSGKRVGAQLRAPRGRGAASPCPQVPAGAQAGTRGGPFERPLGRSHLAFVTLVPARWEATRPAPRAAPSWSGAHTRAQSPSLSLPWRPLPSLHTWTHHTPRVRLLTAWSFAGTGSPSVLWSGYRAAPSPKPRPGPWTKRHDCPRLSKSESALPSPRPRSLF